MTYWSMWYMGVAVSWYFHIYVAFPGYKLKLKRNFRKESHYGIATYYEPF